MTFDVFTIGHSTQDSVQFLKHLKRYNITVVADVRSTPFSRHNPQFNRENLRLELKESGILYLFMGKELGARSDDECCYVNDKVRYDLLAQTALFQSGILRVLDGAQKYRIALMCAEKDPLDCHRTILVARELAKYGMQVRHILEDGSVETHSQAMSRLVARLGISSADMFRSDEATFEEAYNRQADRIAFSRKSLKSKDAELSGAIVKQSRYR